jgi:hypothetical protein
MYVPMNTTLLHTLVFLSRVYKVDLTSSSASPEQILPKNNREALHRVLELLCLIDYNSDANGSNINHLVEGFTSSILRAHVREKENRDLAKKVCVVVWVFLSLELS